MTAYRRALIWRSMSTITAGHWPQDKNFAPEGFFPEAMASVSIDRRRSWPEQNYSCPPGAEARGIDFAEIAAVETFR